MTSSTAVNSYLLDPNRTYSPTPNQLPPPIRQTEHCDICHFDFPDLYDHNESSWTQCNKFPGLNSHTCRVCSPDVDPIKENPALRFVHDPVFQKVCGVLAYIKDHNNYRGQLTEVSFVNIALALILLVVLIK